MDTMIEMPNREALNAFIRQDMQEGRLPDNCIECFFLQYLYGKFNEYIGHFCGEKPEVRGTWERCRAGRLEGCPYEKGGKAMHSQQITINDVLIQDVKPKRRKARTQVDRIIEYLQLYGSITPVQAYADLGIMRLGARIFDIENSKDPKFRGIKIIHEQETAKNRLGESVTYAKYRLG